MNPTKLSEFGLRAGAVLLVVGLLASACGGSDEPSATTAPPSEESAGEATTTEPAESDQAAGEPAEATAAEPAESDQAAAEDDGFPLTFTSCGEEFTIDSAPERVLVMETAVPSLLFAAGAIDRVVARIEDFAPEYYTSEEMAVLDAIPALQAETTSTGGAEVSMESIIDYEPDIVIGYDTETITHDALADVGIQLYVMPPFCDNPPTPSFESIVDEVRFYGELFGTAEVANASADALEDAVASAADAPVVEGKTSAALYVSSDGSAVYAYSSLGMVHPLMEALGMDNVFGELSERVPEVSIEEIIDRNPEILVLLYSDLDVTPEEISALVTDLPGAGSITAVAEGAVYPLLFNFAEPPSPIVVKGLSVLSDQIAE
ncbi:MAG: ABC transporter substrate-binding protein [bacterium]|nr:ABC transporter substrate-binding protein [bacterium]